MLHSPVPPETRMEVLKTLARSGNAIPKDAGSLWVMLLKELGIEDSPAS
ncbi:MAG TPA: hypothetical protein VKR22_08845 [Acidimicrobiales bacterium]|nr:hypothetical protein [Acidimicrobiales bacterium]